MRDAVAAFAGRLQLVGIVIRSPIHNRPFRPKPCRSVCRRCSGSATNKFDVKIFRRNHVFDRLVGRDRLLHQAERFALRRPICPRRVVRYFGPDVFVFERFHVLRDRRHCGFIKAVRQEIVRLRSDRRRPPSERHARPSMKTGVRPSPTIVPPSRIENASVAVRANPRPRLATFVVNAVFQDVRSTGLCK